MSTLQQCSPMIDATKRLSKAKTAFTEAAKLAMTGSPEAEGKAQLALVELNAARSDLKRLRDDPPPGVWAEASRIMRGAV